MQINQEARKKAVACVTIEPLGAQGWTPQYLFATPDKGGVLEKLDSSGFFGEVVTFARCMAALDGMTVAEIKG